MAKTHKIRLLTTGRDLINLSNPSKKNNNQNLILANPSFTLTKNLFTKESDSKPQIHSSQKRALDLESKKWLSLPGTEKEGKEVKKLISGLLLMKNEATSQAVQKINSPKIFHVASHSYFIPNQREWENSLLASGVVLAGANEPNLNPEDDGYLTSLELAALNWKNTELAVISGCESSKGFIKNGESIYGLKRSISIAGARSSLLSLWKVDDIGTAAFMESFYRKLKLGKGRSEALFETQEEFRNHEVLGWRSPYVWAAFQLSGEWRPIDL